MENEEEWGGREEDGYVCRECTCVEMEGLGRKWRELME